MMISKELLSEVTGIPCNAIQSISIGKSIVSVRKINGRVEEYNIHELAHKCKVWAYAHGYILKVTSGGFYVVNIFFNGISLPLRFIEDTEPEAIFKACEWILENRSK